MEKSPLNHRALLEPVAGSCLLAENESTKNVNVLVMMMKSCGSMTRVGRHRKGAQHV